VRNLSVFTAIKGVSKWRFWALWQMTANKKGGFTKVAFVDFQ
jgi:hypothetical protein